MGLRTIVLKLHKPSKSKVRIIDEALLNYNTAFQYILDKMFSDPFSLKEKLNEKHKQYNLMALSKLIDDDLSLELNRYDVQPFKDSLKLEFAMIMASYLRLEDTKPEMDFMYSKNLNREKSSINVVYDMDKLLQSFKKFRPLYFCRYDTKRSYCLLHDKEKDRYFVKMYLLNCSNGRIVHERSENCNRLTYIHRGGDKLDINRKKQTFIIVPLSFGKWQEKILREAIQTPECLKTARLIKKDNGYFFAVSIETGKTQNIKTTSYMGVSRGLKNRLNYTVVGHKGEILSQGEVESEVWGNTEKGISLDQLHKAVNIICDIAEANRSQVIVQNLVGKVDRIGWIENEHERYNPEFKTKDYNCLTRLLEYKLDWRCLPQPIKVSSVSIFYTCPDCGQNSKRNRLNKDFFICTRCGTAMDIEKLGSLNLARKLISYNYSKIKIKVTQLDDGVLFNNELLGLNLYSSNNERQLEKLRSHIQEVIQGVENSSKKALDKKDTVKLSIAKKLGSVQDFMDLIEYI